MTDKQESQKPSETQPTYPYYIVALVVLVCLVLWIVFVIPYFKKLPDHFYYSADILSLDNLYDMQAKKFQGENISKSALNYEVIGKREKYLIIKNKFSVRSLSDKPIFYASRTYYIDPYSQKHVSADGTSRNGYLFAPNFASKKDYTYWHVNYNAPAHMHYVKHEKIQGLTVNEYEANYFADQTENLHHLPNVPEKYGILTKVNLKLWIEPITGWLVKYEDHSIAYFYDIKSRKIVTPWNQFSNRYTQTSINKEVDIARKLKLKNLLIVFGVPFLLTLIVVILFLNIVRIKYQLFSIENPFQLIRVQTTSVFYLLIALSFIISAIYLYYLKYQPDHFIIGISTWNNTPEFAETISGFKAGLKKAGYIEGKNITFVIKNPDGNIEKQIEIIQSFVGKKVNLIFTLTTTGTLIAKGITSSIPIVFSEVAYPVETGVIFSLLSSKSNLVGVQTYISPAVFMNKFAKIYPNVQSVTFVYQKGDPDSEILFNNYQTVLKNEKINITPLAAIDSEQLSTLLQRQNNPTIYMNCDAVLQNGGRNILLNYISAHKTGNFTCDKTTVQEGALIGYFADHFAVGLIAGRKASLILRGADPSWLHTEGVRRGYLILNLKAAQQLNVTIPNSLISTANSVVK